MTHEQIVMCSIILLILGLFSWGRWRYDVVALIGLVTCSIFKIVPEQMIFSGFGHPATFTVALVLIVSTALSKSGAASMMAGVLAPLQTSPGLHSSALLVLAAFLSMFMNNIGALALLMPVAIQASRALRQSPSKILMPLSFASILGGLVTLIGTPPNIIIAGFRQEASGLPFTMFDFTPVGGIIAGCGLCFLCFFRHYFMPTHKTNDTDMDPFQIESYLFQVRLTEKSLLIDKTIKEAEEILAPFNLEIISIITNEKHYTIVRSHHVLSLEDMVLVEGAQDDIKQLIHQYQLSLVPADTNHTILHSSHTDTIEVVIAPGSQLNRRFVGQVGFRSRYHVNLLGLHRAGVTHRGRLNKFLLNIGDVLLIHGEREYITQAISRLNCLPLKARSLSFVHRPQAILAMSIFAVGLFMAALGFVSLYTSLILIVISFVLGRILPIRELYQGVDWSVLILLGAMIPVGQALESTGLTTLLANGLLSHSAGFPDWVLLGIIMFVTMMISDVLNNAATAILMAPIAIAVAQGIGASIDPFLMCVAVGASCSFLTPIGHQNNALVMGPGGYKFWDYWPLGLPLEVIILVVSLPIVRIVWPLYP